MEVDQVHEMEEKKDEYRPFTLKRWNGCAVWTWDVECDTCAICRLQLMEECLRCQADGSKAPEKETMATSMSGTGPKMTGSRAMTPATASPPLAASSASSLLSSSSAAAAAGGAAGGGAPSDCVVVWGECSHSFHNCCMYQWVKQNARCPLCQQDWVVSRIGK
ncbi:hypothetical protein PFISCL1PPCAC_26200 [Pristionchus fissidentatus]|uniref:RING-type domain-containing protein n=1 Tax=Pristionchus fissidentatus TaxID=1538716 RepID=A0AAV5WXC0_9BILA|nr:hypothetical protein PFISCL1PPCAC_26200 [Pristionchus fissidentatus]